VTVMSMLPLAAPQDAGVVMILLATTAVGSVSVMGPCEAVHPLASVTVTLKVPGERLFKSSVLALLSQAKVYVPVPPETVKSIEPSFVLLQLILVLISETEIADGSVMLIGPNCVTQPKLSVMVTS